MCNYCSVMACKRNEDRATFSTPVNKKYKPLNLAALDLLQLKQTPIKVLANTHE